MISATLVLLMTPGLAFFYAGMTRTKHVVSTLLQNFAALGVVGRFFANAPPRAIGAIQHRKNV